MQIFSRMSKSTSRASALVFLTPFSPLATVLTTLDLAHSLPTFGAFLQLLCLDHLPLLSQRIQEHS